MRACTEAGLRAPEVVADDDGTRFGTTGLVMRRNAGEASPRKILSAPEFAPAREVLPRQLAEFLAGLHALALDTVPTAEEREPLAHLTAHRRRSLTDAGGEDERVEPARRRGHRRDGGGDPVDVDVERERALELPRIVRAAEPQ